MPFPSFSEDPLGRRSLVEHKRLLAEVAQTIRRSQETIDQSASLLRLLDLAIDGRPSRIPPRT
jgi:hypothetical protein